MTLCLDDLLPDRSHAAQSAVSEERLAPSASSMR
jgi:hypothetical protein